MVMNSTDHGCSDDVGFRSTATEQDDYHDKRQYYEMQRVMRYTGGRRSAVL